MKNKLTKEHKEDISIISEDELEENISEEEDIKDIIITDGFSG